MNAASVIAGITSLVLYNWIVEKGVWEFLVGKVCRIWMRRLFHFKSRQRVDAEAANDMQLRAQQSIHKKIWNANWVVQIKQAELCFLFLNKKYTAWMPYNKLKGVNELYWWYLKN